MALNKKNDNYQILVKPYKVFLDKRRPMIAYIKFIFFRLFISKSHTYVSLCNNYLPGWTVDPLRSSPLGIDFQGYNLEAEAVSQEMHRDQHGYHCLWGPIQAIYIWFWDMVELAKKFLFENKI